YEHKSGFGYATRVGVQAGGVGTLMACLQRISGPPLMPPGSTFWSIAGHNAGFFAAMGATFALTETVVANQRQKNDPLNGVAGGCAAGFLAGIRARSLPMAAAGCAAVGAAVGGFDYSGQLVGQTASPEKREERRRQFFKQPRPQP
ncbi:hypothetical protein PILCRDRAFT_34454, partial [Piloderma croceum F 1598]